MNVVKLRKQNLVVRCVKGLFLGSMLVVFTDCKKNEPAATASGQGASTTTTPAAQNNAPAAHCDVIQSMSSCRDYRAIAVEMGGADSLRQLCGIASGAYATGPCPTANLVGTCDKPEGIERYYSTGGAAFTAETAQRACAAGLSPGTFRAGP